jgi:carboxyl-terminal processing protease
MVFEKEDIEEFKERYGEELALKIKQGDVRPAFDIFERFLKRLTEREVLVKKLAISTFSFQTGESIILNRHALPWPTAREMPEIWRLRVKHELLQERLNKTKSEEQAKTVALHYERLLRSYKEYDASDVLQDYLTALSHTFDPHSDYMAAPQMENFNINMRLSLVGIGAVLRSEDSYAKIVSLVPGGPADSDKRLKPNDRVEAVAQGDGPFVAAVGMKLDRLVQMIRGEKGTTVRLRVIPGDALDPSTRVIIALVRDEIKLTDQEAKARILTLPAHGRNHKIGVVDLPSFYADMKSVVDPKSTTRDVEKLISQLKKEGIEGLILDLRRNGGGSLPEAVALTGLFIPEGPVVQVKDARGLINVLKDPDPSLFYSDPLVVLTSRASASASEILAAALQDFSRAVIVGEKSTFGKGTVQSITELAQYMPGALRTFKPGALKLTIQKFYRISGGSTQHRGVIPDISLPALDDLMDIAETSLPDALPYDEIAPLGHPSMGLVTPSKLADLKEASAARIAASPEFSYVQEDMEVYKSQKDEKIFSLNENKRLREKKIDELRLQIRQKERLARRSKPLDSALVTLQSIDSLKPPTKSTAPIANADYEKSLPAPDLPLEESAHILADLISLNAPPDSAGSISPRSVFAPQNRARP